MLKPKRIREALQNALFWLNYQLSIERPVMRQDIAYALIALMVIGVVTAWWLGARKARRNRKGHMRIDLFKDDR